MGKGLNMDNKNLRITLDLPSNIEKVQRKLGKISKVNDIMYLNEGERTVGFTGKSIRGYEKRATN